MFMKSCPFCGAQLPEEAIFCLNCVSVLNERKDNSPNNKSKTKKLNFIVSKTKIASVLAVVLAIVIVFSSCLFAIKSVKARGPAIKDTPETTIVPVTKENGEIVTNDAGEQIYEITEVETETTTKKSLFDLIFNNKFDEQDAEAEPVTEKNDGNFTQDNSSNTAENESTSSEVKTTIIVNTTKPVETTTKSSSFWDKLWSIDTPTQPNKETTTKKETTTTTTTTTKPTTTTTTTKPTTTQPSSTIPNPSNITDFQYTEINGEIKITKYIGNSTNVTVPAYIDGKRVALLGENAFAGNSNIKSIVFKGTTTGQGMLYLPANKVVFNSLPNLTTITFPYETYYRMTNDSKKPGNDTFYNLIINCPKLSGIYFGKKDGSGFNSDFRRMYSVDGVVLAQQNSNTTGATSTIMYYPPAKTTSSYTVPSNVYGIETFAFADNPYTKSIHFGADVDYVSDNFLGCKSLSAFTVDSKNTSLFAENGVLYTGSPSINGVVYKTFFYPPGKTDTSFTFTDKYNLIVDGFSFCGNPYIKTATFYKQVYIYPSLQSDSGKPTALTKIRLDAAYSHKIQTNSNAKFIVEYY